MASPCHTSDMLAMPRLPRDILCAAHALRQLDGQLEFPHLHKRTSDGRKSLDHSLYH